MINYGLNIKLGKLDKTIIDRNTIYNGILNGNKGLYYIYFQFCSYCPDNERKIGEVFDFIGHKLKVIKSTRDLCSECFFNHNYCSLSRKIRGCCQKEFTSDRKDRIFKEIL